ncbi:carcinoembryonic antigen-related cell adhesion molecule 1 isoform X1 [Peromyscus eremicus]|uniref:carcinoembryonic antigen-related cell adhesion molecule 1 isoform X1 n=1 Tax=Peromyscus eremicus TaxID=42410 RepID=UPI0027DB9E6F|nr:carcinoembryonic antigen-related cell adhesion molecule 1 isoform X1 [Peromyscus eremicus]
MELTSAPFNKGQVPWRGLLLTVSLLTCWNSPTTAKVTVEAVPPHVAEGQNVLLLVHNLPAEVQAFYWYKGETVVDSNEIARFLISISTNKTGPAYSGREMIYPNGSLLFQNVTQNDTGVYMLNMIMENFDYESASVQFHVHPPLPKPNITTNNSNPMEGEDSVALMCEPKTPNTTYLWRINDQSLSEDDRLKQSEGNRTLTLLSVLRTDTGPYVCQTQNQVSTSQSDPFTLNITYGPDAPIISPSNIYFHSRTNLSLSCHTDANPPAQYSWFVNGELQSSSQELFIPNINTNNSGSYTCLVYNSVTGLNKTTVKNITVLEPVTLPFIQVINTTVKELDSVFLTCFSNNTGISISWLFNGQSLRITDRMKLSQNNSTLTIDPVRREDSGDYQCEVSNPVSSKKSDPIQLNIIPDPTQGTAGLSGGAIAGIVVGAVAGMTLIGALAYYLYFRKTGRRTDQRDLTEHKPSASNHNLGPSDNSPTKVDEVTYSVLDFNAQQPKPPTSASPSPRATEEVYSEVKKK